MAAKKEFVMVDLMAALTGMHSAANSAVQKDEQMVAKKVYLMVAH